MTDDKINAKVGYHQGQPLSSMREKDQTSMINGSRCILLCTGVQGYLIHKLIEFVKLRQQNVTKYMYIINNCCYAQFYGLGRVLILF